MPDFLEKCHLNSKKYFVLFETKRTDSVRFPVSKLWKHIVLDSNFQLVDIRFSLKETVACLFYWNTCLQKQTQDLSTSIAKQFSFSNNEVLIRKLSYSLV